MTIDELIAEAAKIPGWYVRRGYISIVLDGYEARHGEINCPVSAVANTLLDRDYDMEGMINAASELGLSVEDANAITDAANNSTGSDPELRRKLLKTLGLTRTPNYN